MKSCLFTRRHYKFFVDLINENKKYIRKEFIKNLVEKLKEDNSRFKEDLFYEKLKGGKND